MPFWTVSDNYGPILAYKPINYINYKIFMHRHVDDMVPRPITTSRSTWRQRHGGATERQRPPKRIDIMSSIIDHYKKTKSRKQNNQENK